MPLRLLSLTLTSVVIQQATIRAVKLELDAAGIGIPFPQMDLHMDKP